ncbi:hypothetical protein NSZ01_27690 [Nocardioides szechwanensis]|nr:hypothetical protein NSZ01_27690 [Nocardioides szechwanensis]
MDVADAIERSGDVRAVVSRTFTQQRQCQRDGRSPEAGPHDRDPDPAYVMLRNRRRGAGQLPKIEHVLVAPVVSEQGVA